MSQKFIKEKLLYRINSDAGFTILELMSVVTLLAIIVCITVPEMVTLRKHFVEQQLLSQLLRTLNYTRSLSILNNHKTDFCLINNQYRCVSHSGFGFMIYYNNAADEKRIVKKIILDNDKVNLNWKSFGHSKRVTFGAQGLAKYNGSLRFRFTGSRETFRIIVSQSGRVRIASH